MSIEMIRLLKKYRDSGELIRIRFTLFDLAEYAWIGRIKDICSDDRILIFEHDDFEKTRLCVDTSTLNLMATNIWAIDTVHMDSYKEYIEEQERGNEKKVELELDRLE